MLSPIVAFALFFSPAMWAETLAGVNAPAHTQERSPVLHRVQATAPAGRTFKLGNIIVEAPWLRATPRGARVAGGFMSITNTGDQPDRLVGGTLDQAGRFEMHETTMVDNVAKMRPLAKGLEIGPGKTVELKPGGYHIMGLDLLRGYEEGQAVKGTLVFEKAGTLAIEYTVAPLGAKSKGKHSHH